MTQDTSNVKSDESTRRRDFFGYESTLSGSTRMFLLVLVPICSAFLPSLIKTRLVLGPHVGTMERLQFDAVLCFGLIGIVASIGLLITDLLANHHNALRDIAAKQAYMQRDDLMTVILTAGRVMFLEDPDAEVDPETDPDSESEVNPDPEQGSDTSDS